MHATHPGRTASEGAPPFRPAGIKAIAPPPRPGCLISLVGFGAGIAYEIHDQIMRLVVDQGKARSREHAIDLGTRFIRKEYGEGEPIYILEVL